VVGGICTETKDVFLAVCPENKHDTENPLDIIERHVHKDSTFLCACIPRLLCSYYVINNSDIQLPIT